MTLREEMIARRWIRPARSGDPTPPHWHEWPATLRLDARGVAEAAEERVRPPSKRWEPPPGIFR
jgi:hypothetical protein